MGDLIQAEYQQLQTIATRFGRAAEATGQTEQRLRQGVALLRESWRGKGALAFFTEMEGEVLPATARLREALAEAQRTTNEIARTMRAAEEEAAALFDSKATEGMWKAGSEGDVAFSDPPATGDTHGTLAPEVLKRWRDLTPEQRQHVIRSMAAEMAAEYRIPLPPIVFIGDGQQGQGGGLWLQPPGVVFIDPLDVEAIGINMIAHEMRHAFQSHLARQTDPSLLDAALTRLGITEPTQWPQQGITYEQAVAWRENWEAYHWPLPGLVGELPFWRPEWSEAAYRRYWEQPVEVDARITAETYVNAMTLEDLERHIPPSPSPIPAPVPVPTPVAPTSTSPPATPVDPPVDSGSPPVAPAPTPLPPTPPAEGTPGPGGS